MNFMHNTIQYIEGTIGLQNQNYFSIYSLFTYLFMYNNFHYSFKPYASPHHYIFSLLNVGFSSILLLLLLTSFFSFVVSCCCCFLAISMHIFFFTWIVSFIASSQKQRQRKSAVLWRSVYLRLNKLTLS